MSFKGRKLAIANLSGDCSTVVQLCQGFLLDEITLLLGIGVLRVPVVLSLTEYMLML